MSTLLFAWELGAGFGHLAPYRALCERLSAAGHTLVFAARDVLRAQAVFAGTTIKIVQAPYYDKVIADPIEESATYAHLLHNSGYSDVPALTRIVGEWRALYEQIKPDLVLIEHSPTALLALRGFPTTRVLLGNGFYCPPDVYPLPDQRPWLKTPVERLCADEDHILLNMNTALRHFKVAPLARIGQLFGEVDDNILTTLPELDHYPQRVGGRYWGVISTFEGEPFSWPAGDGPKLFGYLRHFDKLPELIEILKESKLPTLVSSDGFTDEHRTKWGTENLQFPSKLLDLKRVCSDAYAGILHGGHQSLLQFLTAGVPLLLFPVTLENFIPCEAVHLMGMGIMVDRDKPEEFAPKLDSLLKSGTYTAAAKRFAARYAQVTPERQGELFIRHVQKLAEARFDPGRFGAPPPRHSDIADIGIALNLHQKGKLKQAAEIYQNILAREPLHADALHLLGAVALQRGNPQRATELIARAIAVNPREPGYHNNQGEAFRRLGQPQQAETCFRMALRLKPKYPDAANNLGLALQAQGKVHDAIRSFKNALDIAPGFVSASNNLGIVWAQRGEFESARQAFKRATELAADYGEAHCNLGQVLLELNRFDEALIHCEKAVQCNPTLPPAHNNLGNVLRELGRLPEAKECYAQALRLDQRLGITCNNIAQAFQQEGAFAFARQWYERALQLEPHSPRIHTNLSSLLDEDNDPDAARVHLERAIELSPDFAEAHCALGGWFKDKQQFLNAVNSYRKAIELKPALVMAHCGLGDVFQELGNLDDSRACFREALKHDPRSASAYGHLATHARASLTDDDLKSMLALIADKTFPVERRPGVLFGLAHVMDSKGDFARAATFLSEANAIKKANWANRGKTYLGEDHSRFVDDVIATYTPNFFERTRAFGSDSTRPIFVLGLPRSGTTLIEQILASHSKIHGAGELRFVSHSFDLFPKELGIDKAPLACLGELTPEAVRGVAQNHLQRLAELNAGAPHIVDKMPDNYMHIGLILTLFPNAKIIHCRRDLRDIAVSCWMTNFRQIRWACDRETMAHRFTNYTRVMDHWRRVLPGRFMEANYEETVTDLEAAARKLIAFVGLEWEPACLDFHTTQRPVRTASVTQVRQPVHTRSVQRWKNYTDALGPLFEKLSSP